MSVTFVTVDRFATETEAHVLVMRLRDAGLHPFVANTQLQGSKGGGIFGEAHLWVQVPQEELSDAQEIAASKLPALSDEDEFAMNEQAEALARCPACGADKVDYTEDERLDRGKLCGLRLSLDAVNASPRRCTPPRRCYVAPDSSGRAPHRDFLLGAYVP